MDEKQEPIGKYHGDLTDDELAAYLKSHVGWAHEKTAWERLDDREQMMRHAKEDTDENGYTSSDWKELRAQYAALAGVAAAVSMSAFAVVLALFAISGK